MTGIHPTVPPLASLLADWASESGVLVYLYGSRARGDFRDDSDVDIYVKLTEEITNCTAAWWTRENETDFVDLKKQLPGRLEILEGPPSLKLSLERAPIIYSIRNVRVVYLAPKQ